MMATSRMRSSRSMVAQPGRAPSAAARSALAPAQLAAQDAEVAALACGGPAGRPIALLRISTVSLIGERHALLTIRA